jgi:hypothetical protein
LRKLYSEWVENTCDVPGSHRIPGTNGKRGISGDGAIQPFADNAELLDATFAVEATTGGFDLILESWADPVLVAGLRETLIIIPRWKCSWHGEKSKLSFSCA